MQPAIRFHVFIRWVRSKQHTIDGDPEVIFDQADLAGAIDRATNEAERRILKDKSWDVQHYKIVVAAISENEVAERKATI